jgi:hypothetical protein
MTHKSCFMENFTIYNPVKLHFGSGVLSGLGKAAGAYGKKALLVYGKGSVKANGAYSECTAALGQAGINLFEYGGIKPNPVIEDVDQAAALGREKEVDMVIAVGGGSVIDSAKAPIGRHPGHPLRLGFRGRCPQARCGTPPDCHPDPGRHGDGNESLRGHSA